MYDRPEIGHACVREKFWLRNISDKSSAAFGILWDSKDSLKWCSLLSNNFSNFFLFYLLSFMKFCLSTYL